MRNGGIEKEYMVIEDASEYFRLKYIFFPLVIFGSIILLPIVVAINLYPNILDIVLRVIFITLISTGVILILKIASWPAYPGYIMLRDDHIVFNVRHALTPIFKKRTTLYYNELKTFAYNEKDHIILFDPKNKSADSGWWDYKLNLSGLPEKDMNEIILFLKSNIRLKP